MGICQALRLNVTRAVKEALHKALAASEGCDCLTRGGVEHLGNLVARAGHLETASAAAECCLNSNRKAVLVRERDHLVGVSDGVLGSRNQGSASALGDVACAYFVAQRVDRVGGRANPYQSS